MSSRRSAVLFNRVRGARLIPGVVLFALVLVGCGGTSSSSNSNKIVIYSVNALTGDSGVYGTASIREQQLLADSINSSGGFTDSCGNKYQIGIVPWDMANSGEQAVAGFRKGASDKSVVAVIGSTPDTGAIPMLPVAGQLKVPYVMPTEGSPISNWNPYSFRIQATAAAFVTPALRALKAQVGLDSIAVMFDQVNPGAVTMGQTLQGDAQSVGAKVADVQAYRAGDTDFRAQLTHIAATHPQWLVISGALPETEKITNQLHDLGISVKLLVPNGDNLDLGGWDATHGLFQGTYFYTPGITGESVKMHDPMATTLYQQKYNEIPSIWGVFGWDALNVILNGIKQTCSATNREKLRDALADTKDFPSASSGTINWNSPRNSPNGDNRTPGAVIGIVTGRGTFNIIATA